MSAWERELIMQVIQSPSSKLSQGRMLADRCRAGVLFTATQSVPIQDWVDLDTWHECKQDHAHGPEQRVEMVVLRH